MVKSGRRWTKRVTLIATACSAQAHRCVRDTVLGFQKKEGLGGFFGGRKERASQRGVFCFDTTCAAIIGCLWSGNREVRSPYIDREQHGRSAQCHPRWRRCRASRPCRMLYFSKITCQHSRRFSSSVRPTLTQRRAVCARFSLRRLLTAAAPSSCASTCGTFPHPLPNALH